MSGSEWPVEIPKWCKEIIREEFLEEKKCLKKVECFYCKSWVSKDYAKEMGLGKDDKMKYVCLKCFKQEQQAEGFINRDGMYVLHEGEYVVPAPVEVGDNTPDNWIWFNSNDTSWSN